ncbi:MAG: DUF1801 domain-containing protein [Pseudomonadota bacterium]
MAKATNKTAPTRQSVDDFLDGIEHKIRRADALVCLALMKKVTDEKPVMWGPSIIGFGQYHYKYDSGREGDMLNVGFSPRKSSLVLYVLGSLGTDEPLLKTLGKYKTGRACLYINRLADVDMGVLEKIIAKSFRLTNEKYNRQSGTSR